MEKEGKYSEWDDLYGKGNWKLAWRYGGGYLDFAQACREYEESYYVLLRKHPGTLEELLEVASDVYDDSVTNVRSGFDYLKQETNRTHIQDIAIRRSLKKLGVWFRGNRLLQIRHNLGDHPLSMTLSPGIVPFHKPRMIATPWLEGWWEPGTVECFYQSNRQLLIRFNRT